MSDKNEQDSRAGSDRKFFAGTRLIREVTYLHVDESDALAERASKERCSKAEIMRRALRAYLDL